MREGIRLTFQHRNHHRRRRRRSFPAQGEGPVGRPSIKPGSDCGNFHDSGFSARDILPVAGRPEEDSPVAAGIRERPEEDTEVGCCNIRLKPLSRWNFCKVYEVLSSAVV